MAEQSKVLNTPGAEKQTKRELFDALRQELESSVLEKASKAVWELILDSNGLGTEICETVENVFCRLSGREPPLFPSNAESQAEKEREKGKRKEREENSKENSASPSKKNKFDDLSSEEGGEESASGSKKLTNMPDSSNKLPQPQ